MMQGDTERIMHEGPRQALMEAMTKLYRVMASRPQTRCAAALAAARGAARPPRGEHKRGGCRAPSHTAEHDWFLSHRRRGSEPLLVIGAPRVSS